MALHVHGSDALVKALLSLWPKSIEIKAACKNRRIEQMYWTVVSLVPVILIDNRTA